MGNLLTEFDVYSKIILSHYHELNFQALRCTNGMNWGDLIHVDYVARLMLTIACFVEKDQAQVFLQSSKDLILSNAYDFYE